MRRVLFYLLLVACTRYGECFLLPIPFLNRHAPSLKSSDDRGVGDANQNADSSGDAADHSHEQKTEPKRRLQPLIVTLALTGHMHLGAALVTLPRPLVWLWRRLPPQLPAWWAAHGLTTDLFGQAAFMASNVAYLGAGAQLLSTPQAPRAMGVLMLVVCVASCVYHAAQCVHGCDSEPANRACTVDSVLAVGTGLFFVTQVHVEPANVGLAALSLAFFQDVFGLGYTASHSLWHFSTAAAAVMSRPRLVRPIQVHPVRRVTRQLRRYPRRLGTALGSVVARSSGAVGRIGRRPRAA